jgi:hypothetical protein
MLLAHHLIEVLWTHPGGKRRGGLHGKNGHLFFFAGVEQIGHERQRNRSRRTGQAAEEDGERELAILNRIANRHHKDNIRPERSNNRK